MHKSRLILHDIDTVLYKWMVPVVVKVTVEHHSKMKLRKGEKLHRNVWIMPNFANLCKSMHVTDTISGGFKGIFLLVPSIDQDWVFPDGLD